MTTPPPPRALSDAFEAYLAEQPAHQVMSLAAMQRRFYMAGALAALTADVSRDEVKAEVARYGRTIGTAVDRATN